MADFGLFSEGWIAAAGATIGAILLKVAERILAKKKENFEQSLTLQRTDQERIAQLWVRLDALQAERDRIITQLREEERAHDALKIKYDELRILLRGTRPPQEP